jgi:hypothetical protein
MNPQIWPVRCDCGRNYQTADVFALLDMEHALTFRDGWCFTVRACRCGVLLGVWTNQRESDDRETK